MTGRVAVSATGRSLKRKRGLNGHNHLGAPLSCGAPFRFRALEHQDRRT